MTITERVINAVTQFEGYSAAYYAETAGVTREQFMQVARKHLHRYESVSGARTYYLKNSAKIPTR